MGKADAMREAELMDRSEAVEDALVVLAKVEAMAHAALAQSEAIPFTTDPQRNVALRRMMYLMEELQALAARSLQPVARAKAR